MRRPHLSFTGSFALLWLAGIGGQASAFAASPSHGASCYPQQVEDRQAVYLTREHFPVHADGLGDDTEALQRAINVVQESTGNGIVFVPEGTYRITKTIRVWAGIRLIGVGARRPEIVLGDHTPGFQEGAGTYLFHFAFTRPTEGQPVVDGNSRTFCSGMSNINLAIGAGNPAAIGVRFHVAQHCSLAHMDFRIGSGRAGIQAVGNEVEDCRFYGGDYGITTGETAPSWPFVLIDSSFEGQRKAALETNTAGPTLIRVQFRHVPTAIEITDERSDNLYMRDSIFEDIAGPAIVISNEQSALTKVNLENIVARNTPILCRLRTRGEEVRGPGGIYRVNQFSHGWHIAGLGSEPEHKTSHEIVALDRMPPPVASDLPAPPDSRTWANLANLGARGDGITDNTRVFQDAIRRHRTLYLPSGKYRVSGTLTLNPDTVLIGLNPITTQILLADATKDFDGVGPPVPLLVAPQDGTNLVSGIGLDTGINRRAVAVKWMAGSKSCVNDVRFLHSRSRTPIESWTGLPIGISDSQYWSLWITQGGGGVFKDIWSPNTAAQCGVYISDTSTEGRVYGMSVEHHLRYEMRLRNVSQWRFYALQTEEESPAGDTATALILEDCRDLSFANFHLYRVSRCRTPYPYGIRSTRSDDLTFRGLHVYSSNRFPFDHSFLDATRGLAIPQRELASLRIGKTRVETPPAAPRRPLKTVVGGFELIAGAVADRQGRVYFTDFPRNMIYRWSPATAELRIVRDNPTQPAALGLDADGDLVVAAPTGAVFSFNPDLGEEALDPLPIQLPRPTQLPMAFHPMQFCRDAANGLYLTVHEGVIYRLTPDRKRIEAAARGLVRTNGIAVSASGEKCYVSDEASHRTYVFTIETDGTLSQRRVFAEEGEGGLAVDSRDRVFLCEGRSIMIYDSNGGKVQTLDVPERPSGMVFGGHDRRTLFITARTSLYQVPVETPGL